MFDAGTSLAVTIRAVRRANLLRHDLTQLPRYTIHDIQVDMSDPVAAPALLGLLIGVGMTAINP